MVKLKKWTFETSWSIIGIIFAIIVIFPVVWIVFTALKSNEEMFAIPVRVFPTSIYLQNFIDVLSMERFRRYFFNSLVVTVLATIINIAIAALAAFAFSRFQFKGKIPMLGIIILTQVLPGVALLIPIYQFWVDMGLINTHASLFVTYALLNLPLTLWLLIGFFNAVPRDIDEAALIDGCSKILTLIYILLPLSKPALFASAIYVSMGIWQEFMIASVLTTNDHMRTLMVGLFSFVGERTTNWGLLMAASVLITIPVMCFFGITQKQFSHGLAGAVKG